MSNSPEVSTKPSNFPPTSQSLSRDWSWPNVTALSPLAIKPYIDAFIRYCDRAHTIHYCDSGLAPRHFALLAYTTPLTGSETAAYISSLRSALSSTHALFPAQEAYRAALEAFACFIQDVVDTLPELSPAKAHVRGTFEHGFKAMMDKEEEVRARLRDLAVETKKAGVSLGVGVYVCCVGEREKNWADWERKLGVWASEVIKELR